MKYRMTQMPLVLLFAVTCFLSNLSGDQGLGRESPLATKTVSFHELVTLVVSGAMQGEIEKQLGSRKIGFRLSPVRREELKNAGATKELVEFVDALIHADQTIGIIDELIVALELTKDAESAKITAITVQCLVEDMVSIKREAEGNG